MQLQCKVLASQLSPDSALSIDIAFQNDVKAV